METLGRIFELKGKQQVLNILVMLCEWEQVTHRCFPNVAVKVEIHFKVKLSMVGCNKCRVSVFYPARPRLRCSMNWTWKKKFLCVLEVTGVLQVP